MCVYYFYCKSMETLFHAYTILWVYKLIITLSHTGDCLHKTLFGKTSNIIYPIIPLNTHVCHKGQNGDVVFTVALCQGCKKMTPMC